MDEVSSVQEEKKKDPDRILRVLYPLTEVGGGGWKAYYPQFLAMLYTDIYMIPVAFSGLLELTSTFTRWLMGPIVGTIIDRFTFKFGKFWHWMLIGATLAFAINTLIYSFPVLTPNAAALGGLIAIMSVLNSLSDQLTQV